MRENEGRKIREDEGGGKREREGKGIPLIRNLVISEIKKSQMNIIFNFFRNLRQLVVIQSEFHQRRISSKAVSELCLGGSARGKKK
jgi:hypothetical protein